MNKRLLVAAIFAALYVFVGETIVPPRVDVVVSESPAAAAGFKPGDLLRSVNGRAIESWSEIEEIEAISAGRVLAIEVERAGTRLTLNATPVKESVTDAFGNRLTIGALGLKKTIPARIGKVVSGSPAEAAGLRPGDLIGKVPDHAVFQAFWAQARSDSFVPPERVRAMRASKSH